MKVIYPNAMICGCPPELFWKLNPRKLEPFYEMHRMEMEHEMEMAEWKAWRTGYYDMLAMGAVFGKHRKYPRKPESLKKSENVPAGKTAMSDVERFKAYVAEFRKERKERDKLKQSHEPD